jgi:hypothetical protein
MVRIPLHKDKSRTEAATVVVSCTSSISHTFSRLLECVDEEIHDKRADANPKETDDGDVARVRHAETVIDGSGKRVVHTSENHNVANERVFATRND